MTATDERQDLDVGALLADLDGLAVQLAAVELERDQLRELANTRAAELAALRADHERLISDVIAGAESLPDDLTRAALLDASASADAASGARLDWWADGYTSGFEAGRQVGYGQAVTDWKVTTGTLTADEWKDIANRPFYTELDQWRYRPGGRVSWITRPQEGERCPHEAAGVPCPDDCRGWTEYDEEASYTGGREAG